MSSPKEKKNSAQGGEKEEERRKGTRGREKNRRKRDWERVWERGEQEEKEKEIGKEFVLKKIVLRPWTLCTKWGTRTIIFYQTYRLLLLLWQYF